MKLLFYDLETTGLDFRKHGIIQFAGILTDVEPNKPVKILDKFEFKMNPGNCEIDELALKVNGYTQDQLLTFESMEQCFNKFIEVLDKYCDKFNTVQKITLCGYNNLHFDNDFLHKWFLLNNNKYFGSYFWSSSIDVLSEASRYFLFYRPAFPNFKLKTVAKALDIFIDETQLHNSLYDVEITLKIYNALTTAIKEWSETDAINLFNKLKTSN